MTTELKVGDLVTVTGRFTPENPNEPKWYEEKATLINQLCIIDYTRPYNIVSVYRLDSNSRLLWLFPTRVVKKL